MMPEKTPLVAQRKLLAMVKSGWMRRISLVSWTL